MRTVNPIDGTSTTAICRRAGKGSGTLFHYFGTKRAIFHALFSDGLERNREVCAEALASDDAQRGLDLLLTHLMADFADPLMPGLAAAALLEANRDLQFAELLGADDERTHETLTTLLTRLTDGNRRLRFTPTRTARWIQRTIDATYLAATDPDFNANRETTDLRRIVDWLVGGETPD